MLRLARLATLVRFQAYVWSGAPNSVLVMAPSKQRSVPMALTWAPPKSGKPGDEYRLDIIQRRGKYILGGSTYVLRVTRSLK